MKYENSLYEKGETIDCTGCGHKEESHANFCSKCNTKLRTTCATCWVKVQDGTGTVGYCKGSKCPGRNK